MVIQDWLDRGYKEYPINPGTREINKLADTLLCKMISDDFGEKYQIAVYCYANNTVHTQLLKHGWSFMPCIQFSEDTYCTIDITLHTENIDDTELIADLLWATLQKPYYEKY